MLHSAREKNLIESSFDHQLINIEGMRKGHLLTNLQLTKTTSEMHNKYLIIINFKASGFWSWTLISIRAMLNYSSLWPKPNCNISHLYLPNKYNTKHYFVSVGLQKSLFCFPIRNIMNEKNINFTRFFGR